jgi:crotonobetainyl-CoA:carnitine CoA-transferase CaiB-like acyl-CoA transferase
MAQPGRYWAPFRRMMQEATGELVGPEELNVQWMQSHFGDLMLLIAKLDELFAIKPAEEWVDLFRARDLLAELVQDYRDLATDPQVLENEMIVTFDHPAHGPLRMVNVAANLRRTPGGIRRPAPEFGQHTEEVLLEHGFSWEELEELRQEGAIGPRLPAR